MVFKALNVSLEIFSFADLPWAGVSELDAMKRSQNRQKLAIPKACPQSMYNVMLECWRLDTNLRASSERIVADIAAIVASDGFVDPSLVWWPSFPTLDERETTLSHITNVASIDLQSASALAAFEALETVPSSINIRDQLGKGQFGTVHRGILQSHDTEVDCAVKSLHAAAPTTENQQFQYEARLLASLTHTHIVKLLAVCFEHEPHLMVLEFMPGGDLKSYLKSHAEQLKLAGQQLSDVCVQIASAMAYLEQARVVHRDLAARWVVQFMEYLFIQISTQQCCRNVLVSAAGLALVKLSDVGLSRTLTGSDYYRKQSNMRVCINHDNVYANMRSCLCRRCR